MNLENQQGEIFEERNRGDKLASFNPGFSLKTRIEEKLDAVLAASVRAPSNLHPG